MSPIGKKNKGFLTQQLFPVVNFYFIGSPMFKGLIYRPQEPARVVKPTINE